VPSRPVKLVLSRLGNVSKISAGWTARCPAHADRVNSLSIAQGRDGRALIYCHSGCEFVEIVAALDLRVRDLFVSQRRRK
jgi:hypothetical protein